MAIVSVKLQGSDENYSGYINFYFMKVSDPEKAFASWRLSCALRGKDGAEGAPTVVYSGTNGSFTYYTVRPFYGATFTLEALDASGGALKWPSTMSVEPYVPTVTPPTDPPTNPTTITVTEHASSEINGGQTYNMDAARAIAFGVSASNDTGMTGLYSTTLTCNGKVLHSTTNAVIASGIYSYVIPVEQWQTLLNGSNSFVLAVKNAASVSGSGTITITKAVTQLIAESDPFEVVISSGIIKKFLMRVQGYFPAGSNLTVKITNNALDPEPVWQAVPPEHWGDIYQDIANKEAINGNWFAIRVEADRGTSGTAGWLEQISGTAGMGAVIQIGVDNTQLREDFDTKAIKLLGSISSYANLPTSPDIRLTGGVWQTTDTGRYWCWTGNSWLEAFPQNDAAPAAGSTKGITSGAVHTAITALDSKIEANRLAAFTYKGEVESLANLPADPELNDVWKTTDTGDELYWSGSEWKAFGPTVVLDPVPTEGSTNPVSSGGVYEALRDAPGGPGTAGPPGPAGDSAYDIWIAEGHTGTKEDFLASLAGLDGKPGDKGDKGDPGQGIPPGGTPGQILTKASGGDFDAIWAYPPAGGSGDIPAVDDYAALAEAPGPFAWVEQDGTGDGAGLDNWMPGENDVAYTQTFDLPVTLRVRPAPDLTFIPNDAGSYKLNLELFNPTTHTVITPMVMDGYFLTMLNTRGDDEGYFMYALTPVPEDVSGVFIQAGWNRVIEAHDGSTPPEFTPISADDIAPLLVDTVEIHRYGDFEQAPMDIIHRLFTAEAEAKQPDLCAKRPDGTWAHGLTAESEPPLQTVIDTLPANPIEDVHYFLTQDQSIPAAEQPDLDVSGGTGISPTAYLKDVPTWLDFTGYFAPNTEVPAIALVAFNGGSLSGLLIGTDWSGVAALAALNMIADDVAVASGGKNRVLLYLRYETDTWKMNCLYSYDDSPASILVDGTERAPLFIGWQSLQGEPMNAPTAAFMPNFSPEFGPDGITLAPYVLSETPPGVQLRRGFVACRNGTWEQLEADSITSPPGGGEGGPVAPGTVIRRFLDNHYDFEIREIEEWSEKDDRNIPGLELVIWFEQPVGDLDTIETLFENDALEIGAGRSVFARIISSKRLPMAQVRIFSEEASLNVPGNFDAFLNWAIFNSDINVPCKWDGDTMRVKLLLDPQNLDYFHMMFADFLRMAGVNYLVKDEVFTDESEE